MIKHCVFYWTNLNYDGRVYMVVKALADAFPDDRIYIYEYPDSHNTYPVLPGNITIIRPKLLFGSIKSKSFKFIKTIEYALRAFVFLLRKQPITIQVHHEIVMYAPLLYKKLSKRTLLVYDDKELYHIKDKNIGRLEFKTEYCLVKESDLVIVANEFRERAVRFMHKGGIKRSMVFENVVFRISEETVLDEGIRDRVNGIKEGNRRILLHQGIVNRQRGEALIVEIAEALPDDWLFMFIGLPENNFKRIKEKVKPSAQNKLINLGYINYKELSDLYEMVDASAIFYLSGTFNNKFCAPNRLYAAANSGKPIIVNADNFVLSHFVVKNDIGMPVSSAAESALFFKDWNRYAENAAKLKGRYELDQFTELKDFYQSIK